MNDNDVVLGHSAYHMNMGFQSLYHDTETNLIYNRARYLDPTTGRFIQRDPLGYPDGLNTYAAYHVLRGGVDPWGMKVVGITAIGSVTEGGDQYEDVTGVGTDFTEAPGLKAILERIQKVRDAANAMTDADFEKIKKVTGVWWRGEKYDGNRTSYIKLADRELESNVTRQRHGSFDDLVKKIEAKAEGLDQDYDIIVVAAHGLYDSDTGKPLGTAAICGNTAAHQVQHKVINERLALLAGKLQKNGVKAQMTFLSCFNTPEQELVSYSYRPERGESKKGQNRIFRLNEKIDGEWKKTSICGLSLTNVTVSVSYGEDESSRNVPIPFIGPAGE